MTFLARVAALPTWATILVAILGVMMVVTGLSMAVGVIFIGLLIGAELGSLLLGGLIGLFLLGLVILPFLALIGYGLRQSGRGQLTEHTESPDTATALTNQYLAGNISEAQLEDALAELLEQEEEQSSTAEESRKLQ